MRRRLATRLSNIVLATAAGSEKPIRVVELSFDHHTVILPPSTRYVPRCVCSASSIAMVWTGEAAGCSAMRPGYVICARRHDLDQAPTSGHRDETLPGLRAVEIRVLGEGRAVIERPPAGVVEVDVESGRSKLTLPAIGRSIQ